MNEQERKFLPLLNNHNNRKRNSMWKEENKLNSFKIQIPSKKKDKYGFVLAEENVEAKLILQKESQKSQWIENNKLQFQKWNSEKQKIGEINQWTNRWKTKNLNQQEQLRMNSFKSQQDKEKYPKNTRKKIQSNTIEYRQQKIVNVNFKQISQKSQFVSLTKKRNAYEEKMQQDLIFHKKNNMENKDKQYSRMKVCYKMASSPSLKNQSSQKKDVIEKFEMNFIDQISKIKRKKSQSKKIDGILQDFRRKFSVNQERRQSQSVPLNGRKKNTLIPLNKKSKTQLNQKVNQQESNNIQNNDQKANIKTFSVKNLFDLCVVQPKLSQCSKKKSKNIENHLKKMRKPKKINLLSNNHRQFNAISLIQSKRSNTVHTFQNNNNKIFEVLNKHKQFQKEL